MVMMMQLNFARQCYLSELNSNQTINPLLHGEGINPHSNGLRIGILGI
jgi:hypothetical protein